LQRRVEKHALIAALTERLAAAPSPLPPPAQWGAMTPAADEFRRVRFTAAYAPIPDAMVYSSGSAVRDDVSGPGTWAFLPARLPTGEIVAINAGFVPNTMQDRAQQDRAVKPLVTDAPVALTGYIRFPESAGVLTPSESIAKRLWFTRDHLAMARARWAGVRSRLSISIWSSRCPPAASRSRARSRSISRTTTCNTPSPGSRWRAPWSSCSRYGCGRSGGLPDPEDKTRSCS
jgi:cytochrome oxidase assembly protein ShyY1